MGITKRELADGTVVYDVREYVGFTLDGKRDRKSVTCKTKREAEIERAKLVAMRDAKRNRSGRMTLADYIDYHWWPVKRRTLAHSTLDGYDRDIRLRIKPALGSLDVRDVDRVQIQRMVDACPTYKVARNALDTLRTVLNSALGDRLIDSNPTRAQYAMPPKSPPADCGEVITRFEDMPPVLAALRAYTDACPECGPSCELVALTGLLMGMRPGERLGLSWSDFSAGFARVRVAHSYTEASAKNGGHEYKDTKTPISTRTLPVPAAARARLAELGAGKSGPMAPAPDGGWMCANTMRSRWQRFLEWCNAQGRDVPRLTMESMRHSFATSYLHAGGQVEDLSRILGHADINTTYRRYVRPSVDDLARGMDAAMGPSIVG